MNLLILITILLNLLTGMLSLLINLIIRFHSSNVFFLEVLADHHCVLVLNYLASLVVFWMRLSHSFIDVILPLLNNLFLILQRERVNFIDFALIMFDFLALFHRSLEGDAESFQLLLYCFKVVGFEIPMGRPEILGIVCRLSVLLLQLIDEVEDLFFLFHAPPQVAFVQDLDFSLLHPDGVFDLFHEEDLLQNVLKEFKLDRRIHTDRLLAKYFRLVLLRYRYFEILAEFNEVALDDPLMILLHFVKCLTLELYGHMLLRVMLEDLLQDFHLFLADSIFILFIRRVLLYRHHAVSISIADVLVY